MKRSPAARAPVSFYRNADPHAHWAHKHNNSNLNDFADIHGQGFPSEGSHHDSLDEIIQD